MSFTEGELERAIAATAAEWVAAIRAHIAEERKAADDTVEFDNNDLDRVREPAAAPR